MQHATRSVETPLGRYVLIATAEGLRSVQPAGTGPSPGLATPPCPAALAHLAKAERALGEYFAGARRDFSDLDLAPAGHAFQQRVWRELQKIPFGATTSYGEVARRVGRHGAARAVGAANRDNPWGIVVPCHRVIGANGSLTGYAGGLARKRWLLTHEGALLA